MAAGDLFKITGELRKFVPEIGASTPVSEFEYAFRQPEGKLIDLIGQANYTLIKDQYNGGVADEVKDAGVVLLQGALANLAGYNIFIAGSSERNATKSMFKYQEILQMNMYLDNANAELGQLLTHLDGNTTTYTTWENTALYKTREAQIIKKYTEFSQYYYIDESAYFFTRLVFLMKEITQDKINPIIGDFSDLDDTIDAAIIEKTKQALAYLTMSMALRRFDFVELPKTLRNSITDASARTIRTGGIEAQAVAKVSSEIEVKGLMYLDTLDRMMEKKITGTIEVPDDIHEDGDNFYLQT